MRARHFQFPPRWRALAALVGCLGLAPAGAEPAAAQSAGPVSAPATEPGAVVPPAVVHLRLRSILHPVAKQFLVEALAEADRDGAALLVIELDTPGGLLSSTREISTAMLGAATPVAVYVGPSGAQAASAR